jgi:hypothetical protein
MSMVMADDECEEGVTPVSVATLSHKSTADPLSPQKIALP